MAFYYVEEIIKLIENAPDIPDNYKYYWKYQYRLGCQSLVPYLTKLGAFARDYKVAEIGAAEGGVLAAFINSGASEGLATDISAGRLEMGRKINSGIRQRVDFIAHDIMAEEIHPDWEQRFDLVLLRDVIEHLGDTEKALINIKKLIKPGGFLFVTFPPYHSPFGGHQHTIGKAAGKIPYIHLLPRSVFGKIIASGRPDDIDEVERLSRIRLTPGKFMDAVNNSGFEISNVDYYLSRPVFKMKFGIPPVRLARLSRIKFVRKYLCLEAAYLLHV